MNMFSFFKNNKDKGKSSRLKKLSIDLSNFMFVSSKHSKYENGIQTASIDNCWRGIEIDKNANVEDSYFVKIRTLDYQKYRWGDDVQMAIKQMKIKEVSKNRLELCGHGDDSMGVFFSDYGISVLLENNTIVKVILKYFYKNVELHYSK